MHEKHLTKEDIMNTNTCKGSRKTFFHVNYLTFIKSVNILTVIVNIHIYSTLNIQV